MKGDYRLTNDINDKLTALWPFPFNSPLISHLLHTNHFVNTLYFLYQVMLHSQAGTYRNAILISSHLQDIGLQR